MTAFQSNSRSRGITRSILSAGCLRRRAHAERHPVRAAAGTATNTDAARSCSRTRRTSSSRATWPCAGDCPNCCARVVSPRRAKSFRAEGFACRPFHMLHICLCLHDSGALSSAAVLFAGTGCYYLLPKMLYALKPAWHEMAVMACCDRRLQCFNASRFAATHSACVFAQFHLQRGSAPGSQREPP